MLFLALSLSLSFKKKATCYPAPHFRAKLIDPVDDNVAVSEDGLVTTSKGPGTALAFALELGEQLYGKEAREKVQKEMLL
jgi:4-methyl-5(b-hydroxyethyl)-thiazole monophosphate biosynthesis